MWPALMHNAEGSLADESDNMTSCTSCIRNYLYTPLLVLIGGVMPTVTLADTTHHYTVTVDPNLDQLHVEARFTKPVSSVKARSRNASRYLIDVRNCDQDAEIRMRNRRMLLPAGGIRCLDYSIDLKGAAQASRNNRTLAEQNFIASPSYWLWRPELYNGTQIEVEFRLPENVQVSVPWLPVAAAKNTYLLGRSPESSNAPAVFGEFDYREIKIPGTVLRVSLLNGSEPMNNDAIIDWIRATATDVSLAYGRFPNPSPQVVVIPVGKGRSNGRSAVPFGRVIRDGGETVELFVDQTQPLSALLSDWTATHEFSHMMVPYIHREQRWISEGFAQYYQNVLLTRSGAYDEGYAWQKLFEGYERGRLSRPELSPNGAAAGGVRNGLMKIYWSGAALALMADVELRRRSNGRESLDSVLEQFQACCLPSKRAWTGGEFFARLDSFIDEPVFMPLYRRYADTAGFPDIRETFARLGLHISDGQVRLKRQAEYSDIRAAITATDPETASWRAQLASD